MSSERAIMYLLIFNKLVMLYGSCWIVISIKYWGKIASSHVCPAYKWTPSSLSGHMRRSCALFTCWPKHEHVPSACFLTTLPCGSEEKQAVHKILPSMTGYTNSWKFYDGLFLSFYYYTRMLRYLEMNVPSWQHIARLIDAVLFNPNLVINLNN